MVRASTWLILAAVAVTASCGASPQPAGPSTTGQAGANGMVDAAPMGSGGASMPGGSGGAKVDAAPADVPVVPPADAAADVPASADAPVVGPAGPWARGLRVGLVEVAQGVFIKIGEGATIVPAAMRNAPLVEGRPAFVRVHVATDAGFAARSLRGVLTVTYPDGTKFEVEDGNKMISGPSAVERLDSTFNFLLPAERVKPSSNIVASIYETGAAMGAEPATPPRFPATGNADFAVKGGRMELWVVVLASSAMVTDTPERRKKIEMDVWDLYPVQKVNIRVRAPAMITGAFDRAKGFAALAQAREADAAKPWEYYHLVWNVSGGIAGTSNRAGPAINDGARRVAMTLVGNNNLDGNTNTTAHELGHNHGRNHAPGCGAAGPDMAYPYLTPPGDMGVNGYSLSTMTFKSRAMFRELMSYCRPRWISDYMWRTFEERVRIVTAFNTMPAMALHAEMSGRSLQGYANPGEAAHWNIVAGTLVDDAEPITASRYAVLTLADGRKVKTAVSVNVLSDDETIEFAINLGGADYSDADVAEAEVVVDGTRSVVPVSGLVRYR